MNAVLILTILLPIIAGLACFIPQCGNKLTKRIITIACLSVNLVLSVLIAAFFEGEFIIWNITPELKLVLFADGLSKLFLVLTSFIWLLVGIFSLSYMSHEKNEQRFFGFMLITLGIFCGLDLCANLVTMYLFFEFATLASVPMVLHSMKKEAVAAAMKYLFYSVAGAFAALISVIYLFGYTDGGRFTPGGSLELAKFDGNTGILFAVILLAIIGFGTKAGMFPMHGWLPAAHPVAPAPASALLSGIIAKAGIFAVIRVVFFVVGADVIRGSYVQYVWIILALITVIIGSAMAYKEKLFKKRLAFSTVSQVSYIMLGLSLLNQTAFVGSILHVVFHAIIKNSLFLVAGAIIFKTGNTYVTEYTGIGKKMPVTTLAYTFASLALIGIPPASGFVSKWFLATGSLESSVSVLDYLSPVVLLVSALLTAGYLLPVTVNGFFPKSGELYQKDEASPVMLVPICILAALTVLLGIFSKPLVLFITNSICTGLF